jgi:hypothetical protein
LGVEVKAADSGQFNLWEPSSLAIGCAAVVNRLARLWLEKRGVWIAAAARQIATKVCSHTVNTTRPINRARA